MVVRAGSDCGRRSRRGATEVIWTLGGVDVGLSRAVRRPAYIEDVTSASSSCAEPRSSAETREVYDNAFVFAS